MSSYFLIRSGESGIHITQMTEETLLDRITPDSEGYHYYGNKPLIFLDHIPPCDSGYWEASEESIVIIKGDFVIPKPVTVATRYNL